MYISVLGYKLNLELLILIGVVYLIMVGHLFCGCSNYSLMEGMKAITDPSGVQQTIATDKQDAQTKLQNMKTNLQTQMAAGGSTEPTTTTSTTTEGFTGANTNGGLSSPYDLSNDMQINTSAWSMPNLTVIAGQPLSEGVKQFLAREPQPVPLPKDELFMFAKTDFKPECCPNTYSTSTGCACMTGPQYNYLIQRGGNNVPYSEY